MALATTVPYTAHGIRNDKRGRARPLLPQLLNAVVRDVMIPRERLEKHGLTVEQVTEVLLQYHTAAACGCVPTRSEPLWAAVSNMLGGLDDIERQFIDPLHQKLVSGDIIVERSKDSQVDLGLVPCLDQAAMFLQHLQDAPWLVNVPDLLPNLRLASDSLPSSSPCLPEIQAFLL